MSAAENLAPRPLVTLHAQPYDIEATGFYFTTMAEYEEKYAKNKNSWGGTVEEYEYQFIDGEGNQELLDRVSLEDFFEIVETWDSDKIEKIELLAEVVGWHYIGTTAYDIDSKLEDMIIYTDSHSMDCLGMEVMENYNPDTYKMLQDNNLSFYFDFERWMKELDGTSFYRNGTYYYIEYTG